MGGVEGEGCRVGDTRQSSHGNEPVEERGRVVAGDGVLNAFGPKPGGDLVEVVGRCELNRRARHRDSVPPSSRVLDHVLCPG